MIHAGQNYRPIDLLPQRPPMLLLDSIIDYDEDRLRAGVNIEAMSLFFEPQQGVPAYVGLEYMAQTAAAHAGLDQVQRFEPPAIALLLGCREYRCSVSYFARGSALVVEARLLMRGEQDFAAYDCHIGCGTEQLARATLKAVRPQNLSAVLHSQQYD